MSNSRDKKKSQGSSSLIINRIEKKEKKKSQRPSSVKIDNEKKKGKRDIVKLKKAASTVDFPSTLYKNPNLFNESNQSELNDNKWRRKRISVSADELEEIKKFSSSEDLKVKWRGGKQWILTEEKTLCVEENKKPNVKKLFDLRESFQCGVFRKNPNRKSIAEINFINPIDEAEENSNIHYSDWSDGNIDSQGNYIANPNLTKSTKSDSLEEKPTRSEEENTTTNTTKKSYRP